MLLKKKLNKLVLEDKEIDLNQKKNNVSFDWYVWRVSSIFQYDRLIDYIAINVVGCRFSLIYILYMMQELKPDWMFCYVFSGVFKEFIKVWSAFSFYFYIEVPNQVDLTGLCINFPSENKFNHFFKKTKRRHLAEIEAEIKSGEIKFAIKTSCKKRHRHKTAHILYH